MTLDTRKVERQAPQTILDALGYAVRADGVEALHRPHNLARLRSLSARQIPILAGTRTFQVAGISADQLYDLRGSGQKPITLGARAGSKDRGAEWPVPKPLPNGLLPVVAFDLDLLPATIKPWVGDITERMQCPADFVGVPAMIGLGAVLGRRVGIRPQRRTDWQEVPNLWGCGVGRPGIMKSPAMAEALKPLHRLEVEARKSNEQAREAYSVSLEAHKLKQVAARTKAKKALGNGADPVEVLSLDEPEAPKDRRYVANDCTYEALGEILADNPNGVLVFRDEVVSLLKTLDREEYAAARGFFLSAWNGTGGYTFDRIIRGHTHIEAACVSLLGSTQPGRLAEYVRRAVSGGAGDDGLIQRFGLLVWPDGSPEWTNIDRYPDSVARQAAWSTFERLDKLTADEVGAHRDQFEAIPFLRFDDEAQEIFDEWRVKLEARLRSADLHPALESHLAKYRKLVPSLALICALTDGGTRAIDAAAVLRALAFADYLETHARRCYAAGSEAETAAAKAILSRVRKGDLSDGFTCRDVHRQGWSNLSEPDQVRSGLNLLVDYDWLGCRTHPIRKCRRAAEDRLSDKPEGVQMTDYLALLKARSRRKHIPDEPPKLTKPGFVGFDGDLGGHFSQATSAAASVLSPPSSVVMAPPDTEPTDAGERSATGWTEAHGERAAVVEFDGGAPRVWAEGFARLDPARPPDDMPQQRWLRFIDDCGQFLDDGWAAKAAALGWGTVDLFGCDRHRPWARIDQAGLLWLMAGRRLVALTVDSATIETDNGGRQTFRRVPKGPGQVLAWSLCGGGDR